MKSKDCECNCNSSVYFFGVALHVGLVNRKDLDVPVCNAKFDTHFNPKVE